MRIHYQTTECSRCLGSGEYSYNPIDGKRCYGCGGTGKALTRDAKKAKAKIDALKAEMLTTPIEAVKVGDVVKYANTTLPFSEVVELLGETGAKSKNFATGEWEHCLGFRTKNNMTYHFVPGKGTMVQRFPNKEEFAKLVELARTLKGTEIVE